MRKRRALYIRGMRDWKRPFVRGLLIVIAVSNLLTACGGATAARGGDTRATAADVDGRAGRSERCVACRSRGGGAPSFSIRRLASLARVGLLDAHHEPFDVVLLRDGDELVDDSTHQALSHGRRQSVVIVSGHH
jgi:hypothetical protein